jgi:hypothetical protein
MFRLKQVTIATIGVVVLLFLATGSSLADKNIFTETYDIGQPQQCEGLALDGVAYSFSIAGTPSVDCTAGTMTGPGNTNDIHTPSIEGNAAGVLHLRFDVPTTEFGFGVALSTRTSPQPDSVIIDLYRPGAGLLRQELPLTATSDPNYVGGHFDYNGPAVRTATIQFASGRSFSRFALDNVTYFLPPGQTKE